MEEQTTEAEEPVVVEQEKNDEADELVVVEEQTTEAEEPDAVEEQTTEAEEPVVVEQEKNDEADELVVVEEQTTEAEEPDAVEEQTTEAEEPVVVEQEKNDEVEESTSIEAEEPSTEEQSELVDEQTHTDPIEETTIEDALKETKIEPKPSVPEPVSKKGPVEVDPTIKLNIFENAFDEEVCDKLKGIITKNMVDSTITTTVENFRKSKTSIIDINEPLIHIVNKKICDIIGADIVRGEPIQGIHYEEGGFFKPHTDYFEANELHLCGKSGNREMTAILYVDDVTEEQEGELVFPILTKRIKPRKGMLVFWNNMRGASPLYTTLNEERPLKSGSKSSLIKYIREKPFF